MANEKRLIDVNALKSEFEWLKSVVNETSKDEIQEIIQRIDNAPAVDAVEVVRCKDCKHWQHVEDGIGDCTNPRFHLPGHADPTMEQDGFCSCGERKDGD